MMWFVYLDGQYVGTVIAADEAEALHMADLKFRTGEWSRVEVVLRRR